MTTKLAFAGVAAFLLALAQSGCANCLKCESPILPQPQSKHVSHKYKPRYAHKTLCPSPCNIKTPFYGFHSTCWSAWPAGWQNCELPCGSGGPAMAPDELDYAEPVDPLTSGAEQLDPMEDQGDSEPSPSDSGDSDDSLPPPAEGEVDEMPADDMPADDAPPALPAEPAPPPANEFDPSALPNEEEDEAADESANEPVNQFEGEAAPEAEAPPTSSRPRPLRAAQHPIVAAPQVAVSQPTVTIQVLEEGSMPPPLEEVVIEEAAPREFSTWAAAAQVTFGDSLEETSEFAAPKLRIGDSAAGSAAVSRPTITIVEVSAEANVKPVASAAAATSDSEFSAGAISVPAPKSSKTGAGKSTPAKGAPARHRLSDDADEAVRPVHWIDAALKASER